MNTVSNVISPHCEYRLKCNSPSLWILSQMWCNTHTVMGIVYIPSFSSWHFRHVWPWVQGSYPGRTLVGAGVIPRQNFSGGRGHTQAELQWVLGSYLGRISVGAGVIPRQNISVCRGYTQAEYLPHGPKTIINILFYTYNFPNYFRMWRTSKFKNVQVSYSFLSWSFLIASWGHPAQILPRVSLSPLCMGV